MYFVYFVEYMLSKTRVCIYQLNCQRTLEYVEI